MDKPSVRTGWRSFVFFVLGMVATMTVAFGPAGFSPADLGSLGIATLCASGLAEGRVMLELTNRLSEIYKLRRTNHWRMTGAETALTALGLAMFLLAIVWGLSNMLRTSD
jgi:hypothetical protein